MIENPESINQEIAREDKDDSIEEKLSHKLLLFERLVENVILAIRLRRSVQNLRLLRRRYTLVCEIL